MKKVLATVLILVSVIVTSMFGCIDTKSYDGEHVDLYTEAINSLLFTKGHSNGVEFPIPSTVKLIETDSYGRKLYLYSESYFLIDSEICFSSLLISQKTEDDFVYFYENINFISKKKEQFKTVEFEESEIQALKDRNDWDKEINLSSCVAYEKRTMKKSVIADDDLIKEALCTKIDGIITIGEFYYLTEDKNGKFICYGEFTASEKTDFAVILFNKDLTYDTENCVLVLEDYFNYQEELAEFKSKNGWVSQER